MTAEGRNHEATSLQSHTPPTDHENINITEKIQQAKVQRQTFPGIHRFYQEENGIL
jgi:phosphatidate phosphatase APP1